jgi:ribonuclease HII
VIIAGVDEVGRGCLAGPVTAAAVILKNPIPGLRDSKEISPIKREALAKIIHEESIYSFASISNDKIDEINIHQATLLAMQEAIMKLSITPDLVYVDGKFIPNVEVNCKAVIGGDKLISEISAASIIAKVHRDDFMREIDKKYPIYDFAKNKGYGTAHHLSALKKSGYTSFHRKSFKGVIA